MCYQGYMSCGKRVLCVAECDFTAPGNFEFRFSSMEDSDG